MYEAVKNERIATSKSNNKYVNMTTTPAGTLAIIIYSLFEHILLF